MTKTKLEINFTKENIVALPLPATGRVTYHDTHKHASGLQLRITATGAKNVLRVPASKGRAA